MAVPPGGMHGALGPPKGFSSDRTLESNVPQATMATCPKCGAKVRKERLRRHVSTVHVEGTRAPKVATGSARAAARAATVTFPWQLIAVIGVVSAVVGAGYWALAQQPSSPPNPPGPSVSRIAVLEVTYGSFSGVIKIHLDERAPGTAANFIQLVENGDYDGNSFHRVAASFVIQGGAVSGAASVAWESTGLLNEYLSVAMARSGDANEASSKDTATSQFFINLNNNPSLDNFAWPYVVFGHVVSGESLVRGIGGLFPSGEPSYDGPPTQTVTITRAYMES